MHQDHQEAMLLPLQPQASTNGHAGDPIPWSFDPQLTLQDLFRETVRLYGERTAVVSGSEQISFNELDAASNRLAHYLTANGIGKGDCVPVWMDRSIGLITALIGIQKAGAAYIPIDAAYPLKRVEHIIADAGVRMVITSSDHRLPDGVKSLDIAGSQLNDQPATPVDTLPGPDDLAYVIYTSGSTGTPKGVMVTQRAIRHLVSWHTMHFGVSHADRLSFVAGTSFDIGVWEIWTALTSGAALYIASDEDRTGAAQLLDYFERNKITQGFVPTVLVPDFVAGSKHRVLSLSYLYTGGEKLRPVNTKDLPYTLVDYYGPTECTVFATYRIVNRPDGTYISSIGKPLAHTRAYILDTRLEPVSGDAIGELFIGGVCLAAGYRNREALTAERFIPDPFNPGERLYRTGDLARRLPDGSIEFIGRSDNQVKVRGYRIELGEVESQLLKISFIRDAIVLVKENDRQQKSLAAFIRLQPGAETGFEHDKAIVQAVRQSLKQELPGYMMPAYFILKESFPANANGKTDVQQLKEQLHATELISADSATGASDMENAIIAVWIGLLDHSSFDVTDNFFDIGGNSLLVAAATVEIAQKMDVKVYMRDIYQHPDIKSLAAVLTERKQSQNLVPAEDTEPVIELQQDVFLDPDTVFAGSFDPAVLADPGHVLLTGVSGLIGIHLLEELLNRTHAQVYCLIRAKNEYDALLKITETARRFRVELDPGRMKRIVPVPGDLTVHNLGWSQEQYDRLSGIIEVVYHSASSVNFIEPYSYNKAANVEGLRRLIRFAGNRKLKCLSLMSTISVYSWGHKFTGKTVMTEQDDISQNLLSVSKDIGYVRSKYVMEAIADLAASKGLPVMTYRLGYAMCHSRTGACATYQWWSNLVKVCLKYNAYPDLTELREGLITIDYMAQSAVHITGQPGAIGKKFNLIASPDNNLTLQQFFDLLQAYYSLNLKKVSYKEWRSYWENDPTCLLYPLTSLFKDNMHEGLSTVELYQHTYVWDNRQVKEMLQGSDVQEPEFNKELFDRYLTYLGIPLPELAEA